LNNKLIIRKNTKRGQTNEQNIVGLQKSGAFFGDRQQRRLVNGKTQSKAQRGSIAKLDPNNSNNTIKSGL